MKTEKFSLHTTSVTEARKLRDEYYKQLLVYGHIAEEKTNSAPEFGSLAQTWFKLKKDRLKKSTIRDYRNCLNNFILPTFGNIPIDQITYLDIETFISDLGCSNKRAINMLIPMRNVFRLALKSGFIEKNPMDLLDPIKPEKADTDPFSMEEVKAIIENIDPNYKNFMIVAFFTGMRFGEMSALKWRNVDFKLGVIKVRETLVENEEGPPKTEGSRRDIKMLPPAVNALRDQRKATLGKSDYVFLNRYGRPIQSGPLNKRIWSKVLKKTGIKYRAVMQTRHTFATLMLDGFESPGWVAKMMGHTSLKMIYEHYYSYIKNYQSEDGQKFIERVYNPIMKENEKTTSNPPHQQERGVSLQPNSLESLNKIE
ncbi:MAG: site-specific integrase [Desulfatiglandales bacterium]